MKIYYITLNNTDEARQICRALLEQKLAVCVNWFLITCAYSWQGEITEEPEVVLIVDLLQKCFLQEVGKGKRLKGNGKIQNLSPLSPSPFPDFCKKSSEDSRWLRCRD